MSIDRTRIVIIHCTVASSSITQHDTRTPDACACSGYMAPEYAYYGHVSTKSDMFSFGVIVLEIMTGQRNSSPSVEDGGSNRNLLSYVRE